MAIRTCPYFDHHITRKVKWLFWKKEYKEGEPSNTLLDWLDAIIFAVVFVTFINISFPGVQDSFIFDGKLSAHGRSPLCKQTDFRPENSTDTAYHPIHSQCDFGKESYSTLIQNEYRRLKGFRNVERGDYVVFGFPDGDTVLTKAPADDYYAVCRFYGKNMR